jgi:hypothetical protein
MFMRYVNLSRENHGRSREMPAAVLPTPSTPTAKARAFMPFAEQK